MTTHTLEAMFGAETTHVVTGREFTYGIRDSNGKLVFRFGRDDRRGAEETMSRLRNVRPELSAA